MPNWKELELSRAFWHSGMMVLIAIVAQFIPQVPANIILFFFISIIGYWEMVRNKRDHHYISLNAWILKKLQFFFRVVLRQSEKNCEERTTALDFLLALLILYNFTPLAICQTTIIITSICDPMARICGRSLGQKKIFIAYPKTWVGSVGCLLSAFGVGVFLSQVFFGFSIISIIITAVVATVAEAVPDLKYRWWPKDNFRITLCVGLVLQYTTLWY